MASNKIAVYNFTKIIGFDNVRNKIAFSHMPPLN